MDENIGKHHLYNNDIFLLLALSSSISRYKYDQEVENSLTILNRPFQLHLSYINLFTLFLAALGLRCCMQAFLWLWRAGATLRCGAQASHCGGFSCWEHGL